MTDFLLELRSEEIPARMQAGARAELEKLFRKELEAAGVAPGEITVWSTPRRLALIARGLPQQTHAVSEELKGPKVGAPPQALEGFLRKTGLSQDQLTERDGVYFAVSEKPGRAVKSVLAEAIPAIVRAFAWPKSMRWGAASISSESPRWVRPLSGIVAIFGEELVECEAAGIASGYATVGHRFHHPGEITIGGADDYAEKLRACHVIVDHAEREAIIRDGAAKAAADAGLTLVEDEGLVIENAGLTEWPVPLLGRFDEAFLEVPPEVIQLTARTNQKYFVCTKPSPLQGRGLGEGDSRDTAHGPLSPTLSPEGERELANAFVCTANVVASDGGAGIVDGNRKVLAARLSDARFFWEQDRKKTLEQHAEKLASIVFHEKLGTVADKVERVAKLARWLVEEGIVNPSPLQGRGRSREAAEGVGAVSPRNAAAADSPHPNPSPEGEGLDRAELAALAEQAARLAKADLVTEMVGEFPELQGLMGGYYARAEGPPDAVADAIRDHYKPVGQGDEVPTAPVTVAVSLADKLDTLIGFFAIDEKPTGSKDPFALRRAILGILELLVQNDVRYPLRHLFAEGYRVFANQISAIHPCLATDQVDADFWSPLLADDAAYLREAEAIFVLSDEPPLGLAAQDEFGREVWKSSEVRARGLVKYELAGFLDVVNQLTEFAFDRLRDRERRAGRRADVVQSVLPIGSRIDMRTLKIDLFGTEPRGGGRRWYREPNRSADDDVNRILMLSAALQNFIATQDGANLLAAYKRAANILKKEDWKGSEGEIARTGEEDPLALVDDPDLKPVIEAKLAERRQKELSYTPEAAEKALIDALDSAEPKAAAAVSAEDFEGAMAALASLRAPIDRFFDEVTVNDAEENKRAARLDLLARFRAAVHKVADFSKIEG